MALCKGLPFRIPFNDLIIILYFQRVIQSTLREWVRGLIRMCLRGTIIIRVLKRSKYIIFLQKVLDILLNSKEAVSENFNLAILLTNNSRAPHDPIPWVLQRLGGKVIYEHSSFA